jgi:NUMOD4 motif-containing protein/HNH endonuclease
VDECSLVVERWLPVVGWIGHYEVSDLGRVRSLDRVLIDRLGRVRKYSGRVLRQTANRSDYRRVSLKAHGVRRESLVHHLVLNAFVGPMPPGQMGCHGNGTPSDNRLSNLRWGTNSDNLRDAVRHGTHGMTKRTHCPRGHALTQPNLTQKRAAVGHRHCLACARARSDEHYARVCGRQLDLQATADQHYARVMGTGEPRKVHWARSKTHCPRGHELKRPNLKGAALKRGCRTCLACSRAHDDRRYELNQGRPFDFESTVEWHYKRIMNGLAPEMGRSRRGAKHRWRRAAD